MKLFSYDGVFMRLFNRLFDLMLLTLVWTVCSIPIVTAGAATTALYDTVMKLLSSDPPIIRYYFMSFKNNFKKATICWLILLALIIIVAADYVAFMNFWPQYLPVARTISILLGVCLLFTLMYIFPTLTVFSGNTGEYLLNAFVMSFVHAPSTIVMILIYGVQLYMASRMFLLMGILMLVGQGVAVFFCSHIFRRIFKGYISGDI